MYKNGQEGGCPKNVIQERTNLQAKLKVPNLVLNIACTHVFCLFKGSVLVNDFWTPCAPSLRVLSILYMTIYFSANLLLFIFCYLGLGQVKTLSGPSALRLGWARGPSAAATGQVSSDTFWAERCDYDRLGGRAMRPRVRLSQDTSCQTHVVIQEYTPKCNFQNI